MKGLKTLLVISMMFVPSILLAQISNTPGSINGMESDTKRFSTRSMDDVIYFEDTVWIPDSFNEDRLWIVAYFENRDRYDVMGSDDETYGGHVLDNSLSFPVDGETYNSGEKRRTLLEIFTSTDCPYCPGPEGASGRLIDSGVMPEDVSLIQWHVGNSDPYRSSSAGARYGFYGGTGTPTVAIDGDLIYVGGDSSPENKHFDDFYLDIINYTSILPFGTELEGHSFYRQNPSGGYDVTFNVSATQIGPLQRGNWSLRVTLCEDIQNEIENHRVRMVGRSSHASGILYDLQESDPRLNIDERSTFSPFGDGPVRENLTIKWNATDPEDGEDLSIHIQYWAGLEGMKDIATHEDNDGSYVWNTKNPRVPDGSYVLRVIAVDKDGNSIQQYSRGFEIDNLDAPEINITSPKPGESISGSYYIKWDSFDDEDPKKEDLLCKVSLSDDSGETWKVITYDFQTGGDFIINQNQYRLNTLNYDDMATYMIKVELKDSHGLRTVSKTGIFEIYNNDKPLVDIISPVVDQTISTTLDIGWKVEDQEDPPSEIWGNFTVRKLSDGSNRTLFEGYLDDDMDNKTYPTSELFGDGAYKLIFKAKDSRGGTNSAERTFIVYDPNYPVIESIMGPDDGVKDSFLVNWSAHDPDGESLTYSIHIREENTEEWALLVDDLTVSQYEVDASSMNQANWFVRITAEDSSPLSLKSESVYGPFYLEVDEKPVVSFVSPPDDFVGTIGSDDYKNKTANEPYLISWEANDPDGDDMVFILEYRYREKGNWIEIASDIETEEYLWNFSTMEEGKYYLRVTAIDDSEKQLKSSTVIGPFNILLPDEPPQEEEEEEGKDTNAEGGPDILLFSAIGIGLLLVVIVIVVIVMLFAGRRKKKSALPEKVDLSVPDFRGAEEQGPISGGTMAAQQTQEPPQQQMPDERGEQVSRTTQDQSSSDSDVSEEGQPADGEPQEMSGTIEEQVSDNTSTQTQPVGGPEVEEGNEDSSIMPPPPQLP